MSKPTIFISYSHKDERLKDRLVSHLGVLQQEGLLEVWEDRRIGAGGDWEREIEAALNKARVAILLISDHFLNSKFILTKEVPVLMRRRISDGLHVIPVILSDYPWQKVSWLSPIQSRPKDGKALTSFMGNNLFGRERELQLLDDAWADLATNVVTFVAWGGVGKTALVNHWVRRLAARNYDGAARAYAWSFYSQGTGDDRAATAEYFINDALGWFGDPDPTDGSPWAAGSSIALAPRIIATEVKPMEPAYIVTGTLTDEHTVK